MENENGKCVVKHRFYKLYYCYGNLYKENLYEAKIFDFKKLPENIRNNPTNEIIPLNTEKGLELLVEEIQKIRYKIEQEKDENKVKKMKEGLEKLYNSNPEMIDKYNSEHAKYPSINAFSPERRRLTIKEIVNGKA